jgi:glutathione S-transferase
VEYEEAFPTNWAEMKQAGTPDIYTFGQLPHYVDTDAGVNLVQSCAILRHIGRTRKAYGSTEAEMARVDVAIDGISDLRRSYSKLVYQDNLAAEPLAAFKTGILAAGTGWIPLLERFLAANPAGPAFLVGSSVTIADYALFDLLNTILRTVPDVLASAPGLAVWYAGIAGRAGIKSYIESNPAHREKANGNGLG